MGSTSAENHGTEGVGRRDLIKRSAALGLISVPTMSFLSACASSGGDDSGTRPRRARRPRRTRSVSTTAPSMEFVLFDGGFGKEYAEDAVKIYEKDFPEGEGEVLRHPEDPVHAPAPLQPGHPAGPHRQLRRRADGHGRPGRQEPARRPHPAAGRARPTTTRTRRSATRCAPASWRWASSTARRSGSCTTPTRCTASGTRRRPWTRSTSSTPRPGTRCSRSARRPRRRAWRAGRTRASTRTTCPSRSTR